MKLIKLALVMLVFLNVRSVLAVSPVDSGSLLNQEIKSHKRINDSLPSFEEELSTSEARVLNGDVVYISKLEFSGAVELLESDEISGKVQRVVLGAEGREYDFLGLQELADRITLILKQEGWILARAYLPQQDVSSGVLTIAIIQGVLDSEGASFVIESSDQVSSRVNLQFLESLVSKHLEANKVVHEGELERAVLLINDLSGVSARARLSAGEEVGSTRVNMLVTEQPLFSGRAQTNNFGNVFTGESQLLTHATINNVTGYGDQLSASATVSEGVRLGQFSYGFPLGYQGWSADLAYTSLEYDVVSGRASAQADYDGEAQTFSLDFNYPFVRSVDNNVWLNLGYQFNHFQDRFNKSLIADKKIDSGYVGLRGDYVDRWQGGGRSSWSISWKHGYLDLSDLEQQQQNDDNSFRASGAFNKFEYSVARSQYITENLSLFLELSGQVSDKNLDSSQKFFPGGVNGVRAYSGGEGASDNGQLLRADIRYIVNEFPKNIGDLQLLFFYDRAWVKLSHDHPSNVPITNYKNSNRYSIAGIGAGLNLVKEGSYAFSANWARKVGENPGRDSLTGLDSDESDDKQRLWLQAVLWF